MSPIYGDISVHIINPKFSIKKKSLKVGDSFNESNNLKGVPEGVPIAWESSNQNVIQVLSGNCVAVGIGKSVISAYACGKRLPLKVNVVDTKNSTLIFNASIDKPYKIKGIKNIKNVKVNMSGNKIDIEHGVITVNTVSKDAVSGNGSDGHTYCVYGNNTDINKTDIQIKIGEKVLITPKNCHEFPQWKIKDNKIASISEYGVLIGQSQGSTTLKSKFGGKKVTINVEVLNKIDTSNKDNINFNEFTVIDGINGNKEEKVRIYENGSYEIIEVSENAIEDRRETESENEIPDEPEKLKYTIEFNSDGGSEVESQTVEEGGKATRVVASTKDRKVFMGWNDGDFLYNFDESVSQNKRLKANWVDDNDNDGEPDEKQILVGIDLNTASINNKIGLLLKYFTKGNIDIEDIIPIKDGYTFIGWRYQNGNFYNNTDDINRDTILIATWQKK